MNKKQFDFLLQQGEGFYLEFKENFDAKNIARDVTPFLPQAVITCVLHKGNDKVHILDRKDFTQGILTNYENAMNFINRNLRVSKEDFQQNKQKLRISAEKMWRKYGENFY